MIEKRRMNDFGRRQFIRVLGRSLLASVGMSMFPCVGFGEDALDYALKGQAFIEQKKYLEAIQALKKAVEINPGSDWAYGLLGRACHHSGKMAEAVAAFREAARLNPEDTYSRMMVDIITQKPLPVIRREKPRELTPLEKEALKEESEMLSQFGSDKGLSYRVRRIVIDPGHGGFDSGAVGKSGLMEKDVTLDIALKLYDRFKKEGTMIPFLTRTDDYFVPLAERAVSANQFQADLFLSLHINANEKSAPQGSETYFCSEKASSREAMKVAEFENSVLKYDDMIRNEKNFLDFEGILRGIEQKIYWRESERFANQFQGKIRESLPFTSRGINSANFYVLRKANMPAILLELGFISNENDEAKLKKPSFRDQIAESISRGIL